MRKINRECYKIKDHIIEGLILVSSLRYDDQLWVISNQTVRKNHECSICGKIIFKSIDKAFRPLTNLGNRMDRMCFKCSKRGIF